MALHVANAVTEENLEDRIHEHLFMGNTHSRLNTKANAQSKNPHIWSAFISLEPDRVVPPMTVKKVVYYLHPTFNRVNPKAEKLVSVQKTPFKITYQGYDIFRLRAEIEFDPRCGPRERLTCSHMLQFDCSLSTTDTVSGKKFFLNPTMVDHLQNTDPITYLNKISNINYRERCSDLQNQCTQAFSLSNANTVRIAADNVHNHNNEPSSLEDIPITVSQKIEGEFNDLILSLPKQQELKTVVKRLNANRLTGLPNRVAFRMWYHTEMERRRERLISQNKTTSNEKDAKTDVNEEDDEKEEKKNSEARKLVEEQAQEYQSRPFGMIYMDISDLHVLNEIITHQVMDEVIIRIANVLRTSVDASSAITHCVLYHWDGGEFVVIMAGTENELLEFGQTLIRNISSQQDYIKEPIPQAVQNKISMSKITLCAGYALHSIKIDFGEWIAEADRGLELAKRQGPGSVVSATRLDVKALTQELFKGIGDEYPAIGAILQSIRNGADLDTVDKVGDSALAGVLKMRQRKRPMVQTLIHQSFNPRLQDRNGNTHLMISMLEGWDDGIVLPLALQALNPNLINNEGHTALDIALRQGYKSVVEMLSKYALNSSNLLNDRKHCIAWFNACKLGKFELLQQYVALGFPVDAFDATKQRTGLAWACRQGQIDSIKFLLNPKTFESFENATLDGIKLDQKTKKILFEKHQKKKLYPANVNLGDQWNLTPLHVLLGEQGRETDTKQILMLLLNAGANVNVVSVEQQSPLHEAVWQEHFEACRILIEKGANMFVKDKDNRMPIIEALVQWANPERKK